MLVVAIRGRSGAHAVTINTAGIYSVNLGSGDDTLVVNNPINLTAHGGVGNDSLTLSKTAGSGQTYGASGQDTISASSGTWTIFGGTGAVDPGDGKDFLTANTASAIIYGNGGNDTIEVDSGQYTLYGGNGNDSITASSSAAIIYGEASSDTVTVEGGKYSV